MPAPKRIHFTDHHDRLIKTAYKTGHRKTGGVAKAAEIIGVSTTTIYRRAVELGVLRAGYKPTRRWEEQEVALLESHADKTLGCIAGKLIKAGYPRRTEESIKQKLKMLGIGRRDARTDAGLYTVRQLAILMGSQTKTISNHITAKRLVAKKRDDRAQTEYEIKAKDVRQFFKDYAPSIDITTCDKYWLIDILTGAI